MTRIKIKLLLLALLTIPFVAKGQTTDSHKEVFYNKGAMYVGPAAIVVETPTTAAGLPTTKLYVKGSMNFANGSAVSQEGTTALTGNFISSATKGATQYIFTPNSKVLASEAIFFTHTAGQLSDVTNFKLNISGYEPNSTAVVPSSDPGVGKKSTLLIPEYFEKQYIMPSDTTDLSTYSKDENFINFPNIVLDANTYVALHPKVAITALGINPTGTGNEKKPILGADGVIVNAGALFSVEAKYRRDRAETNPGTLGNNILLDVSHLLGNVTHVGTGSSMIDWQLYNSSLPNTNLRTSTLTDTPSNARRVALTGFTPMFKRLGADYMFFNALTAPGRTSISQHEAPVKDPLFSMVAGKGYFVGMDVSTHDAWDIQAARGVSHVNKAVGGYLFNRSILAKKPGFNKGSTDAAKYETFFNSVKKIAEDGSPSARPVDAKYVTIPLFKGLNFLGNPFTAPLDLSDLITSEDIVIGQTDFHIAISASSTPPATVAIRNKYYLPYDASVAYVKKSTISSEYKYSFSVKYYDVQAAGGTNTLTGVNENLVAPMQMFAIEASQDGEIRLPYSKVRHGKSMMVKNIEQRKDEFLIQVLNTETNGEDRTSIVLREGVSLKSIDAGDSHKGFQDAADDNQNREVAGLVYTMSEDARPMLTNMVPLNTKQLPLYIVPSTDKAMKMKLTPYRMETMESTGVWLEDKEKNTFQELTPEFSYDFVLAPVALTEELKNRFVLHFAKPDTNLAPESLELPITCYYNSSVLTILGLNDDDMNSSVLVYDLQGRLVAKTTVNNAPQMTYPKALSLGTYILKIAGKRNHTVKFVNLQN